MESTAHQLPPRPKSQTVDATDKTADTTPKEKVILNQSAPAQPAAKTEATTGSVLTEANYQSETAQEFLSQNGNGIRSSIAEIALERLKDRKEGQKKERELAEIERQKAEQLEKEAFAEEEKEIMKYPSFNKLAVHYLRKNKKTLAQRASRVFENSGINEANIEDINKVIFNNFVYPEMIKDNIVFQIPSMEFEKFINNIGFKIIRLMIDFYSDNDWVAHTRDGRKIRLMENSNVYARPIWNVIAEHIPQGEMSIGDLINCIIEVTEKCFKKLTSINYEHYMRGKYRFFQDLENDKGYQLYINCIRSVWKRMATKSYWNGCEDRMQTTNEEIEEFIDVIIGTLTGQKEGIREESVKKPKHISCLDLPTFDNLENLRQQLLDLMKIKVTRGEVHKLLEGHIFEGNPISEFADKYRKAPKIFGKTTKKKMRLKLEEGKVDQSVAQIYNYLKACIDLHKIGEMLFSKGATPEQRSKGELIKEMAAVYAEKLNEFAVEAEVQLSLEGFELQGLIEHLGSLSNLRKGNGMAELDQLVKGLEKEEFGQAKVQAELDSIEDNDPEFKKMLTSGS